VTVQVLSRQVVPIATDQDAARVRQMVRELAIEGGCDSFAVAAITTAASELARNVWRHAGSGEAVIEKVADGSKVGVRLELRDQGPGIADVERVLAGGYSTVRSLGLGISGSRRLVDHFELNSRRGEGTVVRVIKWARR
jgi:serine/threonine-protein kinase RsbT